MDSSIDVDNFHSINGVHNKLIVQIIFKQEIWLGKMSPIINIIFKIEKVHQKL